MQDLKSIRLHAQLELALEAVTQARANNSPNLRQLYDEMIEVGNETYHHGQPMRRDLKEKVIDEILLGRPKQ